jgi:hypothetical protein
MATKTRQRPPASTGRFSRPGTRKPQKPASSSSKPLSALTGLLPGSKSTRGGGKSKGGLAAAASKITSRFGSKKNKKR